MPTPGGPDDFPRLMSLLHSLDPADTSLALGALVATRRVLGECLGIDRSAAGLDARVESLRARLPEDLSRDTDRVTLDLRAFRPVYLTDDEAAFEIANATMHGVLHIGWVRGETGDYRGQVAVLVKPNGLVGRGYLAAIAPFRRFLYPQLLGSVAQRWRRHARQVDVPTHLTEASTLPRVDYADAFVLSTDRHPDWTAETWARAVLEGAPAATRAELTAGWAALGLPATNSSASVLGWAIRRSTPERVLLGRDSHIGMPGELLFELRPDGLVFATFVFHRTPATRAVWAAVRRTHVRTVLELLDRTVGDGVADVTLSVGNQ